MNQPIITEKFRRMDYGNQEHNQPRVNIIYITASKRDLKGVLCESRSIAWYVNLTSHGLSFVAMCKTITGMILNTISSHILISRSISNLLQCLYDFNLGEKRIKIFYSMYPLLLTPSSKDRIHGSQFPYFSFTTNLPGSLV